MGPRNQHTTVKREAVQLLELGSRPASELARELGVARDQLDRWQTELRPVGPEFIGPMLWVFSRF